jgi:hypothetical protein
MSDAAATGLGAFEAPPDVTPVRRLAQRDGAIALAALSLFAAADAWYIATGSAFASLVSVLDGVAVGVVVTFIAHEWAHFAGARFGGGIAPTTTLTTFFPLFNFDMKRSDPGAFRAMSVAGNVAHWAVVLLLFVLLPLDTPGQIALASGAFGFAIFASTTEFPIIQRAYSGASPIESFAGFSGEILRRNRWIGAGAALLLFWIL